MIQKGNSNSNIENKLKMSRLKTFNDENKSNKNTTPITQDCTTRINQTLRGISGLLYIMSVPKYLPLS